MSAEHRARRPALAAFALALFGAAVADAQEGTRAIPKIADANEASIRMRETEILGEREMPKVLFILPRGRGGALSVPHRRDYSADITRPIVKPWLERDEVLRFAATPGEAEGPSSRRAPRAPGAPRASEQASPPPPPPAPPPERTGELLPEPPKSTPFQRAVEGK